MDYAGLKNELLIDPLGRGYAGMTSQQKADSLNAVDRERNRETMTASEILNAVVSAEYSTLQAGKKDALWGLLGMGILNPFGIEADVMVDIFGAGSGTITALAALRKESVSRAGELGLPRLSAQMIDNALTGGY